MVRGGTEKSESLDESHASVTFHIKTDYADDFDPAKNPRGGLHGAMVDGFEGKIGKTRLPSSRNLHRVFGESESVGKIVLENDTDATLRRFSWCSDEAKVSTHLLASLFPPENAHFDKNGQNVTVFRVMPPY